MDRFHLYGGLFVSSTLVVWRQDLHESSNVLILWRNYPCSLYPNPPSPCLSIWIGSFTTLRAHPLRKSGKTTTAINWRWNSPGISKDAIEVKATEHGMAITAERTSVDSGEDRVLSEFHYGSWRRNFYFGKRIDPNQLQAELQDGVLHVTAPKVDSVKAVSVKVRN